MGKLGKGMLVGYRKFCQYLSINLNGRLEQTIDQPAVRQAMFTGRGVDTRNPEGAEHTFFLPPVPVGILPCLGDGLLGDAINILAPAPVTLGLLNNFFVSGVGGDPAFYSRHDNTPLTVWQHARNRLLITVMSGDNAAQMAFSLGAFLGQNVAAMRLAMFELARGAARKTFRCTTVTLHLGHYLILQINKNCQTLILKNYPLVRRRVWVGV